MMMIFVGRSEEKPGTPKSEMILLDSMFGKSDLRIGVMLDFSA